MILMGITNRTLCGDFYEQINNISKSSLDYLVIREKDLDEEGLLKLSLAIKDKLKNTNIQLIVNSNINVAKKIQADGVQLSFKDFLNINEKLYTDSIKDENSLVDNFKFNGNKYKIYKTIGVSIHSYEEGIRAYEMGADYVIYGHVFQTDCKRFLEPRGVKEIEHLSKKIRIPIIGIGGIGEKNYKEVLCAGAKGIALMSSLMKSENPQEFISNFYK